MPLNMVKQRLALVIEGCRIALSIELLAAIVVASLGTPLESDAGTALFVDGLSVDGQEMSIPGATDNATNRLQLSSGPHRLVFDFGPPDETGPPLRLRYRLEGFESTWREAGGEMQLSLAVLNAAGEVLGLHISPLQGASAGWTNDAAHWRFTQRRESVHLPRGAESLRVVFSSGNWDTKAGASHPTVGLAMIDECRVSVRTATNVASNIWPNPSFEEGEQLDLPTGLPLGWQRGELGRSMAKILTLTLPDHRHVLALDDDNPRNGTEWRCELDLRGLARGGDDVVVDWQELFTVGAAGGHDVEYPYVPPGEYVFRVEGFTPTGEPAGCEAALIVSIPQVFWKRLPFLAFSALGALTAAALTAREITRRRMGRDLERLEIQRTLERERARIARDMHDDLGSGLTRMALLSRSIRDTVDPQSRAAEELDHIHQTSQELTRSLDEIVWAVDPAHDSLDGIANYLGRFAQDFLATAGLECRLDLPTQLPRQPISADTRHNLFLAFKEVLNNAVRHSGAREVNIALTVSKTEFVLSIQDDGRGFDPGSLPAAGIAPGSMGGHGIANLRNRLVHLGGVAEIESGPGGGTRVLLRVPLASSRE
jgi:signal transduction histidine kinase